MLCSGLHGHYTQVTCKHMQAKYPYLENKIKKKKNLSPPPFNIQDEPSTKSHLAQNVESGI